jgi:hypothetical protein
MMRRRLIEIAPPGQLRRSAQHSMTKILSLLLLLITAPSVNQAASDQITSEEYSVYSGLINSRFLPRGTNLAVIEAHTQFDINTVPIPKEFEDDLLLKIAKTYTLDRRFRIRVKYLLLTQNQLDDLFKPDLRDGWDSYWKTYRHATGLLSFSRVAFNATKDQAFVCASETCGALCGNGYSFVLTKQKGTWTVAQEKHLWIS